LDANLLVEMEYDYCIPCGKLVERSEIIFFDPKRDVSICRNHESIEGILEEYKRKASSTALKKKFPKKNP